MRLTSDQVLTILGTASRLSGEAVVVYLGILPLHGDFAEDFTAIDVDLDLLI